MKNQKCVICSQRKGKRSCRLYDYQLICPTCCAKIRNAECEGCRYYKKPQVKEPEASRLQKTGLEEGFIIEIRPDLDEEIDKALELLENGKTLYAQVRIERIYKKFPEYGNSNYAMGVLLIQHNKIEEAVPYLKKAVELNPLLIEAWFNLGMYYIDKMEIIEGIEAFQKVVELGDASADFVKHAKEILDEIEKTIANTDGLNLDEYVKVQKAFLNAFNELDNKNFEEAIKGFKGVLRILPKHKQALNNLGLAYAHSGEKEKAIYCFKEALKIDPKYIAAKTNLNLILSLGEDEDLLTKMENAKTININTNRM